MGERTAVQAGRQKDYDTPEKDLEGYPDVFADVINAFIYQGKKAIRPEHLKAAATETYYKDPAGKLKRQLEDLGKYEEVGGEAKALFLLANQQTVDSRMILRKCGYIGGCYRGQYNGQEKRICPVVELVLYWGEERWDSARSVKRFFRRKKLPDELWEFIDDEKLHVFEMRHLSPEVIDRFTSDMRIVLEYLSDSPDRRYLEQEVRHVQAFLELMNVLTKEERYRQLIEDLKGNGLLGGTKKGGGRAMVDIVGRAWEDGRNEGVQQGIEQGVQQGIQQGIRQGIQALVTACKELGATFEETSSKVREKFSLTEAEVQRDMKLYW